MNLDIITRQYFKKLRLSQECKLSALSHDLSIPQTYISQWENNKRNFDFTTVEKLYRYFDLDYPDLVDSFEASLAEYHEIFKELAYLKQPNSALLKRLTEPSDTSFEHPFYLIIKLLLVCSESDALFLSAEINENNSIISDDYMQMLHFALGCHYHLHNSENSALKHYRQALTYGTYETLTPLVQYNLASSLFLKQNYGDSYHLAESALSGFEKEINLKRIIAARNLQGLIHLYVNMPAIACRDFEWLLAKTTFLNENYLDNIILNNLTLSYISVQDYKSAYKYSLILIDEKKVETAANYFYAAWASYKMGKIEQAVELIDSSDRFDFHDDFHYELIVLTHLYITQQPLGLQLIKCYRSINARGTSIMKQFILRLLIEFYGNNPTEDKPNKASAKAALRYAKELIELQSRQQYF